MLRRDEVAEAIMTRSVGFTATAIAVMTLSSPAKAEETPVLAEPRSDQALLYILRPEDPGGGDMVAGHIYIERTDGTAEIIAATRGDSYTFAHVPPGRQYFFSPGAGAAYLELVPGETYYLVAGVFHGFFLVEKEVGQAFIAESGKYIELDEKQRGKGMDNAAKRHEQSKELIATWLILPDAPAPPPPAVTDGLLRVPQYSEVVLALDEPLSSQTVAAGEVVTFRVADEIRVDGSVWLAAGTMVEGTVTWVQPSGRGGKAGNIRIDVMSVSTTDGTMVPVLGQILTSAKRNNAGVMFGALGALAKGDELALAQGETFSFFTRDDVWVRP
jgi:hypothetical protein